MFVAMLTFIPGLAPHSETKTYLSIALPLATIAGTFCAGAIAQYAITPTALAMIAYVAVAALISLLHWTVTLGVGLLVPAALLLMFSSGIVQGATFATIPFLSTTLRDQSQANGAVAQLGNLGATIGPPIFSIFISSYGSFGLMIAVVVLCGSGAAVARNAAQSRN
jgi:nitrate/nitrite transporter NarK